MSWAQSKTSPLSARIRTNDGKKSGVKPIPETLSISNIFQRICNVQYNIGIIKFCNFTKLGTVKHSAAYNIETLTGTDEYVLQFRSTSKNWFL
jgi:hypothetical protein